MSAIAAMTAAITPSKTVPCRVVNSLLDMMFSTVPPSTYLVSAGVQLPNAFTLQSVGSGFALGSVYFIQKPQTMPLSAPAQLPLFGTGLPSGQLFAFSASIAAPGGGAA